jgi:hypothetical protein
MKRKERNARMPKTGCLRVCFNVVSILSFTFGFFQAFFSFVLSLFSLLYSRGCFGITTATFSVFGQRQDKAEKRLKETESKRKYRNNVKTNSQTTPH